ncbi:GAF and ANTAR domain-containing protein [Frankia nepalensis]|uniref:GAF and ANTAR domain-containing protein n=1 Tax=Frankia nepalensis TaxID=1836974 RepID=UPI0027DD5D4B|nr:GAF and ANTAR domain-containing protein [Frankia nepalensis]
MAALDRLCVGVVSALPVDGAAISVTSAAAVRGYSGASNPICARLDDLQFTLGEGPCWHAVRYGRPVLVGDLTGQSGDRWPMFTPAVLAAGFRAIFAFPLQIGAIRLGTLGFFCARSGLLDGEALGDALVIADIAALTFLDTEARDSPSPVDMPPGEGLDGVGAYRAEVHQATGMAMAQLGVSAQEALVRLRAHAFAAGLTVDEVACEIVARRLRLDGDLSG